MGKLGEWLKAAVWHATHPLAGMVTVVVALILLVGAVKAGVALAMPALLAAVVFGGLNMSLGQEWWLGELAPRHGPLLANLTSTLGALPEGRTVQAGGGSRYAAWRLRQRYAGVYVPVDQLAVLVTELVEAERGGR